jgi:hypothetical protein
MKWDLLVSDCNSVYLINAKLRDDGYVRSGALICVNTTQSIATFTLADQKFRLLVPNDCLDAGQITKTFNLDLPVLDRDEQVRIPDPR